jgi:hypothetical protein
MTELSVREFNLDVSAAKHSTWEPGVHPLPEADGAQP